MQLKTMTFTTKSEIIPVSRTQIISKYNIPRTLELTYQHNRVTSQKNKLMEPMINNILNAKKGGCKSCGR